MISFCVSAFLRFCDSAVTNYLRASFLRSYCLQPTAYGLQPIASVLLTLNFFAAREVFSYAALASLAVSAALAVSRALITIRPLGLST